MRWSLTTLVFLLMSESVLAATASPRVLKPKKSKQEHSAVFQGGGDISTPPDFCLRPSFSNSCYGNLDGALQRVESFLRNSSYATLVKYKKEGGAQTIDPADVLSLDIAQRYFKREKQNVPVSHEITAQDWERAKADRKNPGLPWYSSKGAGMDWFSFNSNAALVKKISLQEFGGAKEIEEWTQSFKHAHWGRSNVLNNRGIESYSPFHLFALRTHLQNEIVKQQEEANEKRRRSLKLSTRIFDDGFEERNLTPEKINQLIYQEHKQWCSENESDEKYFFYHNAIEDISLRIRKFNGVKDFCDGLGTRERLCLLSLPEDTLSSIQKRFALEFSLLDQAHFQFALEKCDRKLLYSLANISPNKLNFYNGLDKFWEGLGAPPVQGTPKSQLVIWLNERFRKDWQELWKSPKPHSEECVKNQSKLLLIYAQLSDWKDLSMKEVENFAEQLCQGKVGKISFEPLRQLVEGISKVPMNLAETPKIEVEEFVRNLTGLLDGSVKDRHPYLDPALLQRWLGPQLKALNLPKLPDTSKREGLVQLHHALSMYLAKRPPDPQRAIALLPIKGPGSMPAVAVPVPVKVQPPELELPPSPLAVSVDVQVKNLRKKLEEVDKRIQRLEKSIKELYAQGLSDDDIKQKHQKLWIDYLIAHQERQLLLRAIGVVDGIPALIQEIEAIKVYVGRETDSEKKSLIQARINELTERLRLSMVHLQDVDAELQKFLNRLKSEQILAIREHEKAKAPPILPIPGLEQFPGFADLLHAASILDVKARLEVVTQQIQGLEGASKLIHEALGGARKTIYASQFAQGTKARAHYLEGGYLKLPLVTFKLKDPTILHQRQLFLPPHALLLLIDQDVLVPSVQENLPLLKQYCKKSPIYTYSPSNIPLSVEALCAGAKNNAKKFLELLSLYKALKKDRSQCSYPVTISGEYAAITKDEFNKDVAEQIDACVNRTIIEQPIQEVVFPNASPEAARVLAELQKPHSASRRAAIKNMLGELSVKNPGVYAEVATYVSYLPKGGADLFHWAKVPPHLAQFYEMKWKLAEAPGQFVMVNGQKVFLPPAPKGPAVKTTAQAVSDYVEGKAEDLIVGSVVVGAGWDAGTATKTVIVSKKKKQAGKDIRDDFPDFDKLHELVDMIERMPPDMVAEEWAAWNRHLEDKSRGHKGAPNVYRPMDMSLSTAHDYYASYLNDQAQKSQLPFTHGAKGGSIRPRIFSPKNTNMNLWEMCSQYSSIWFSDQYKWHEGDYKEVTWGTALFRQVLGLNDFKEEDKLNVETLRRLMEYQKIEWSDLVDGDLATLSEKELKLQQDLERAALDALKKKHQASFMTDNMTPYKAKGTKGLDGMLDTMAKAIDSNPVGRAVNQGALIAWYYMFHSGEIPGYEMYQKKQQTLNQAEVKSRKIEFMQMVRSAMVARLAQVRYNRRVNGEDYPLLPSTFLMKDFYKAYGYNPTMDLMEKGLVKTIKSINDFLSTQNSAWKSDKLDEEVDLEIDHMKKVPVSQRKAYMAKRVNPVCGRSTVPAYLPPQTEKLDRFLRAALVLQNLSGFKGAYAGFPPESMIKFSKLAPNVQEVLFKITENFEEQLLNLDGKKVDVITQKMLPQYEAIRDLILDADPKKIMAYAMEDSNLRDYVVDAFGGKDSPLKVLLAPYQGKKWSEVPAEDRTKFTQAIYLTLNKPELADAGFVGRDLKDQETLDKLKEDAEKKKWDFSRVLNDWKSLTGALLGADIGAPTHAGYHPGYHATLLQVGEKIRRDIKEDKDKEGLAVSLESKGVLGRPLKPHETLLLGRLMSGQVRRLNNLLLSLSNPSTTEDTKKALLADIQDILVETTPDKLKEKLEATHSRYLGSRGGVSDEENEKKYLAELGELFSAPKDKLPKTDDEWREAFTSLDDLAKPLADRELKQTIASETASVGNSKASETASVGNSKKDVGLRLRETYENKQKALFAQAMVRYLKDQKLTAEELNSISDRLATRQPPAKPMTPKAEEAYQRIIRIRDLYYEHTGVKDPKTGETKLVGVDVLSDNPVLTNEMSALKLSAHGKLPAWVESARGKTITVPFRGGPIPLKIPDPIQDPQKRAQLAEAAWKYIYDCRKPFLSTHQFDLQKQGEQFNLRLRQLLDLKAERSRLIREMVEASHRKTYLEAELTRLREIKASDYQMAEYTRADVNFPKNLHNRITQLEDALAKENESIRGVFSRLKVWEEKSQKHQQAMAQAEFNPDFIRADSEESEKRNGVWNASLRVFVPQAEQLDQACIQKSGALEPKEVIRKLSGGDRIATPQDTDKLRRFFELKRDGIRLSKILVHKGKDWDQNDQAKKWLSLMTQDGPFAITEADARAYMNQLLANEREQQQKRSAILARLKGFGVEFGSRGLDFSGLKISNASQWQEFRTAITDFEQVFSDPKQDMDVIEHGYSSPYVGTIAQIEHGILESWADRGKRDFFPFGQSAVRVKDDGKTFTFEFEDYDQTTNKAQMAYRKAQQALTLVDGDLRNQVRENMGNVLPYLINDSVVRKFVGAKKDLVDAVAEMQSYDEFLIHAHGAPAFSHMIRQGLINEFNHKVRLDIAETHKGIERDLFWAKIWLPAEVAALLIPGGAAVKGSSYLAKTARYAIPHIKSWGVIGGLSYGGGAFVTPLLRENLGMFKGSYHYMGDFAKGEMLHSLPLFLGAPLVGQKATALASKATKLFSSTPIPHVLRTAGSLVGRVLPKSRTLSTMANAAKMLIPTARKEALGHMIQSFAGGCLTSAMIDAVNHQVEKMVSDHHQYEPGFKASFQIFLSKCLRSGMMMVGLDQHAAKLLSSYPKFAFAAAFGTLTGIGTVSHLLDLSAERIRIQDELNQSNLKPERKKALKEKLQHIDDQLDAMMDLMLLAAGSNPDFHKFNEIFQQHLNPSSLFTHTYFAYQARKHAIHYAKAQELGRRLMQHKGNPDGMMKEFQDFVSKTKNPHNPAEAMEYLRQINSDVVWALKEAYDGKPEHPFALFASNINMSPARLKQVLEHPDTPKELFNEKGAKYGNGSFIIYLNAKGRELVTAELKNPPRDSEARTKLLLEALPYIYEHKNMMKEPFMMPANLSSYFPKRGVLVGDAARARDGVLDYLVSKYPPAHQESMKSDLAIFLKHYKPQPGETWEQLLVTFNNAQLSTAYAEGLQRAGRFDPY